MALFEVTANDRRVYEEINACRLACERLGLTKADVEKIFWSNSARIFGVK